jgi:hypothetical protein
VDRRRDPADAGGSLRLVAIDGKTCRSSHDRAKGLGSLHIVSAWASEEAIALGQVATDVKSNEITAIPQLLEQIELAGTLITIDAMGCQKAIVEQIVASGGDCVITVKDNQPIRRPFYAPKGQHQGSPGHRPGSTVRREERALKGRAKP